MNLGYFLVLDIKTSHVTRGSQHIGSLDELWLGKNNQSLSHNHC